LELQKTIKIDHIGIVVHNLEEILDFLKETMDLSVIKREILEDRGLEIATFPIGDLEIELITRTRDGTAIDKFLEKRGGGLHHIAIVVKNLEEEIKRIRRMGIEVVDGPRKGRGGCRIAFLDPRKTFKVLIELIEK